MRPRWKHTLVLLTLIPSVAFATEQLEDGIAAQVGTDIVLVSEVMQMVAGREARMRQAGMSEADIARLRAEGLETMIEWRLIERVVRDADLGATDAEVDSVIESIAHKNGLTLDQLKKTVTTQNMSYANYREEIKRELERRKVVNAMVGSRVRVEEDEIKALYAERFANQPDSGTTVHLAQILLAADPDRGITAEHACAFMGKLRERILGGESFENVARQYSVVAPQQGGDIGWLHMDSMAGWMVEMIEPLQAGELSSPHELPSACTMVELVERKDWKPVTYDEMKDSLYAEIYDRKVNEEYRKWMDDLRAHTFIERRGYFADAARFTSPKEESQSDFEKSLGGVDVLGGDSSAGTANTP